MYYLLVVTICMYCIHIYINIYVFIQVAVRHRSGHDRKSQYKVTPRLAVRQRSGHDSKSQYKVTPRRPRAYYTRARI